jgi:hypothetical protein
MASFGETLKRERETRNISLRDVANATKISIRFLEALEENRFEILPGGVFNKGFVRACAVHLGIDSEALVGHYLREVAQRSAPGVPGPAAMVPPAAPAAAASNAPVPPAAVPPATAAPGRVISIAQAPGSPPPIARPAGRPAAAGPDRPGSPSITFATEEASPPRRSRGLVLALVAVAVASLIPLGFRMFSTQEAPSDMEPLVAHPGTTRETAETLSGELSPADLGVPEDVGATRSPEPLESITGMAIPGPDPAAPLKTAPSEAKRPPAPRAAPAPTNTQPAATSPPGPASLAGAEPPRSTPVAAVSARADAPASAAPGPGTARDPEAPSIVRRAVPAPGAATPQPETMTVQIETTRKNWVYLFCDSREVIDRNMLPGESLRFDCLSVIRVSAHDAGAVHMAINGARCMPLGDDGAEVYGYTIRVDDFRLICPWRSPAASGRP